MFGSGVGMITISGMEKNDDQQSTANDPNALEKPTDLNALDMLSDNGDGVASAPGEGNKRSKKTPRRDSKLRRIWSAINVYLLIFLLLVIVAGIVFVVSYLNSQKEPELPSTALQDLTQEELKEISSGDSSVGDPRYILNIKSDAVFAGNALIRGDLNVAGSVQMGQPLTVPSISVSGTSNLGEVQINTLRVAGAITLQSALNLQDNATINGNLNVGGTSVFNGSITAPSITTGSLTLAGNGALTINNHIIAKGPTPSRSSGGSIGNGGSTSVSGSDTTGTVNINTGSGASSGCLITVNFVQPFQGTPKVMLTPVNAAAGTMNYYVNRTSTSFSVCAATNPGNGRSFSFDYFVIN
jgi:hypothetical protein